MYYEYWLFPALALQRSVFRENCSKFLTFIARSVGGILCETKEHSRSEMKSNRQTDTHKNPTTVTLAAHARQGLMTPSDSFKIILYGNITVYWQCILSSLTSVWQCCFDSYALVCCFVRWEWPLKGHRLSYAMDPEIINLHQLITKYIGMTQVVLHYAHTLEISLFNFLLVVVVVQFRQAYLKNRVRYGYETLHRYWNPWQVVQEHFNFSVNNNNRQ